MWWKILLRSVKRQVRTWLDTRALVVPLARRTELAHKLHVSIDIVDAVLDVSRGIALSEFDKLVD